LQNANRNIHQYLPTALPGITALPKVTPENVVFGGVQSLASVSHHIVTAAGSAGNGSLMQISTLLSYQSFDWVGLKGRRVVLATPMQQCMKLETIGTVLRLKTKFSTHPRVAEWFTTQLPCEWSAYLSGSPLPRKDNRKRDRIFFRATPREPVLENKRNDSKPIALQDFMATNLPWKDAQLRTAVQIYNKHMVQLLGTDIKKMHLIPMGARDPLLLQTALRGWRASNQTSLKATLLMDCTCAFTSGDRK
jgi:hypothetical protein